MVGEKNHHVSDALIIQRKNYQPLHTGGSFVLGQEQDAKAVFADSKWDPGFEPGQSLSGSLAQVELWDTILTPEEIKSLSNCEIETLRPENRVITWGSSAWDWNVVDLKEVKLNRFCEPNLIINQFVWPKAIDFHTLYNYCQLISGMYARFKLKK